MDVLDKNKDYLISYEEKEDKLIEHYIDSEVIIPNIKHNRDILDRRLEGQFYSFLNSDIYKSGLELQAKVKNISMFLAGCIMANTLLRQNTLVYGLCFSLLGINIASLNLFNEVIKRVELTKYCLNNIDKVNKIVNDPYNKMFLSNSFNSFSLNNQHEYTTTDLVNIKKLVKIQEKTLN